MMWRWYLYLFVLLIALGGMTGCGTPAIQEISMAACPVSQLRSEVDVEPGRTAETAFRYNFANDANTLYTNLWPDGKVTFTPDGPGEIGKDGSLSMKWPWYRRNVEGKIAIEGRRLDAPATPLRYQIAPDFGETGFQPSVITFSSEGCWEVTAKVGDHTLTFVTLAVRSGH